MDQALITVTIPFDQNVEAVQQALAQLGNPADGKIAKKLDDTEVVHFMSLNVLQGEEGERSHLLLEASCDGSEESALEAIERALSQELGAILALAHIGGARIGDVLHEHSRTLGQSWWSTLGLPFAGTPGMSVRRIRKEHELARRISAVLQEYPAHNSPSQLLERVRNRIWAQGDTKWAFSAEPAACVAGAPDSGLNPLFKKSFGDAIGNQPIDLLSGLRTAWQICLSHARTFVWPLLVPLVPPVAFIVGWYRSGFIAALGWLATALVLVWPAVTVFTVWLILRLRALEKRDDPVDYEPHKSTVEDQMKRETYFAQNLMFAVSTIKPGWVRRLALRFGLWSVTLVRYFCRPGFLGTNGIIHFARWMQVPGTDKLLFYSNYDGTWMGYVGDFVVNPSGAHGVTGIWSNCVGFPRTRGLSEEGAVDRDRLVRWARNQSRAVPFWYSGYPELTTERIRINAAIRQGLACAETNSDALDWLSCFGSMARAARTLEIAEIPTLAIGGLGKKKWHATCLVVHFNDDSNKCRSWLNKLQPHVTYGEVIEGKSALVLGLTGHALEQIGLAPEDLATFPVAFQQGMNTSYRARALGDLDKSAPSEWDWGGEKQPEVDAIVLIYGEKDFVARTKSDLREQIEDYGHSVQYDQEFAPHSTEPFGFADGISQPAIRGTRPARSKPNQNDIVEAGELVLGYPDNIGRFPPTPSVSADADPARLLSNAGEDPYRQRPEFSRMLCGSRRDLGRNGTFLVVRQLDQDVDAFDEWLDKASNEFAHRVAPTKSAEHVREMIAAKVIGRWKNGTPLVRHPDAPGPHPKEVSLAENDFNFGEEDPAGLRCPLGAHIRRANPRDSLTPGSSEQLAAVNRHRILRVGRRYDAQDGKHPGLLFMCVNVDIERQFEFIQQRWLVNPSFHGLHGEADASLHSAKFTVPSDRGPVQLTGLHQFVTTRGGAYFFLPSRTALQFLAKLGSWGSYKIDPPTEATASVP